MPAATSTSTSRPVGVRRRPASALRAPVPSRDGPADIRGLLCCLEVRETVRFHVQDGWRDFELDVFSPFGVRTRAPGSSRWDELAVDPAVSRDRERCSLSAVMPLLRCHVSGTEVDPGGVLRLVLDGACAELVCRPAPDQTAWRVSGETVGNGYWWCRPDGRVGFEPFRDED